MTESFPEFDKWIYQNIGPLVKEFKTASHCLTTDGTDKPFVSASFSPGGLAFLIQMVVCRYERLKDTQ